MGPKFKNISERFDFPIGINLDDNTVDIVETDGIRSTITIGDIGEMEDLSDVDLDEEEEEEEEEEE